MKDKIYLSDVADIIMGQSPDSSTCNSLGIGLPFLQGCGEFGKKHPIVENYCTQPKKISPENSILISVRAPVGDINLANQDFVIGRGLAGIVAKSVDRKFLYYSILQNKKQLERVSQGSTFKAINTKNLHEFEIVFFNNKEQQKIAKILSTVDNVIEKTENAIAKYQDIKQGLMHDLFTRGIDVRTGQLRPTPQEVPELYKESALGLIPLDWTEGQFIDFADEHVSHSFTGGPFGSDLQTKHYTKEGVRIIQLQNIGDGHFKNGYKIFTSEERANYLRACNIYPGDIILSKMAEPIARACIIPPFHERYLMASDGIRLSINKKKFNLRFVLETINQKRFRNIAEIRATGTTRSRIGLTELKEIPVCYPNREEQSLIGKKLDDLEENISIEQQALAKYQQLKAGLLQDLLTGTVEVGVDEEIIND